MLPCGKVTWNRDDHHRLPDGKVMQLSALKVKEFSNMTLTATRAREVKARRVTSTSALNL
jgi:hypothetical protein